MNFDDPSYECILDGESIPINKPLTFPENNWILCSAEGLKTDKEHNITVRATVRTMTFYFDRVQYIPSNNSDFDTSAWLLFGADHPSVTYDSGWSNFRDIGRYTTTNGASAEISYFGRSLIFSGAVPSDFAIAATTAEYAVDDGKPTPFRLAGLPSSQSMEQYNQAFFQTPLLPQGQHTLKITYRGDNATTPLTHSFFMVQRDPIIPSTGDTDAAAGNNTASNSSGTQDDRHDKSRTGIAGIVGGVVGGMVLMGLLIGLIIWFRRHRRVQRRKAQYRALEIEDAIVGPIDPFVDNEWDPSTSLSRPSMSTPPGPSYPMLTTSNSVSSISGSRTAQLTDATSMRLSDSHGSGPQRHTVFLVTNADPGETQALATSMYTSPYPSGKKGKGLEVFTYSEGAESSLNNPSSSSTPYSPIVVRHEDSGIRLGPRPTDERAVVDIPPSYTPG
ncbi:hypothetical protein CVT24_011289 [Panaeolus cyanescens]|uniref:receptor protein-tyrosine kinase n=1 Tax=Panaeolus cyanescens TaxID=181874 RepID=A0A409YUZ2_9AGAR|nr:hypothetical protein CVT24_011289 [Panaeolus cyanescens]